MSNPISSWIWGGMQYQIEHHLFPSIPRSKLPALKPIIEKFAEDNNIEGGYRESGELEILRMNWETYTRNPSIDMHAQLQNSDPDRMPEHGIQRAQPDELMQPVLNSGTYDDTVLTSRLYLGVERILGNCLHRGLVIIRIHSRRKNRVGGVVNGRSVGRQALIREYMRTARL